MSYENCTDPDFTVSHDYDTCRVDDDGLLHCYVFVDTETAQPQDIQCPFLSHLSQSQQNSDEQIFMMDFVFQRVLQGLGIFK